MLIKSKHNGWLADGTRTPFFGGGGGGGGQTTSTGTTYTTNLPEYAQPYVETMLGATQRQLFQTQPGADGATEITGFQPYTPYSTDPSKSVAGFSPLQQQAQQTVAGMQTPGTYGQAQGLAGMSGMGQLGTAQQAGALGQLGMLGASAASPAFGAGQQFTQGITDPRTMGSFMSPYQQQVTDIAKADAVRNAQMAQQATNLGAARQGTYGGARQALMQGEREKNLLSNLSSIQAQGSQSAYDRALAQQQFGANLGLQGIQTGLQGIQTGMQGIGQGIGAQQAGYAGAGQAASTMGSLAGQEFGTQKDIIGMQQQAGAQQQQQQQQIVNQAIQDYANAQQYPMMQLGFMSNMLRGLPMQSTNTQQYAAAPNQLTQGIGALGAGANIYSAFQGNPTRVAEGGQIKSYAKGGIASYDVGGNVKSDLSNIRSAEELREIARNTTSDRIREEALRFAKMREMGLAGGGIVAFAEGQRVRGKTLEDYMIPDSDELKARSEADVAAAMELNALRNTQDTPTNSIMFDQMKNRQTNSNMPMLERPENFKVDAVAAAPEPKPKKNYERVADSLSSIFAPSKEQLERRGIVQAAVPPAVKETVKKEILAPLTEPEVDKSDKAPAAPAPAAPVVVKENEEAPTGIKAAQPPATKTTVSDDRIPGLSPTMQALYDKSTGRQQSIDEIMTEKQAAREKYVGADTRPEERARLMAEKANMKDEDARNRKLQLAQFFASWGSTPGSTLQAAMVAVNKHIPTIIASDKEARKAQNEVDKIIRELNKAERMEKEGDVDGAFKIKSEQSKKYEDLNKTLMTYQGQKENAQIRATNASDEKDLRNYKDAVKVKQAAEAKYNKIISDSKSEYNKAKSRLAAFKNATGEAAKAQRESAEAIINQVESEYKNSIAQAQELVDLFASKGGVKPSGGEKKADKKVINLDNI